MIFNELCFIFLLYYGIDMQERLIEIIVYLLGHFQQPQSKEDYSDLSRELKSRGYTENEINLAFTWIFNHLQNKNAVNEEEFSYVRGSTRVLHDVERLVIDPQAYGYLLQMQHLGLLSDSELEFAIEKALSMGTTTITIDDIKSIAASIIFNSESTDGSWDGFFFHPGTNTIH